MLLTCSALDKYSFQECFIKMDLSNGDQNTTVLIPYTKELLQPKDMTQFSITDFILVDATFPEKGIHMGITMKRKIMSEMHTCKKRVMLRRWLFWPKKFAEKVRKSRQNVNRDKSA